MNYMHISSIAEIDGGVSESLKFGSLCGQPVWYQCFEKMLATRPDHLLIDNTFRKLVPLYHFDKPTNIFTHNLTYITSGGLLGNASAKIGDLNDMYPVAISVPPFCYRYSICSSIDGQYLMPNDVNLVENRAWANGARMFGFLYLDRSHIETQKMLKELGYFEFPIAVRWELHAKPGMSYESWLSELPAKKRTGITRDLRQIKENNIEVEVWKAKDILNGFDVLLALSNAHYEKYGFGVELQKFMADAMSSCVSHFGERVTCFVAKQHNIYVGFTLCIESDHLFYVKFTGYKPGTKYAYFLTNYYLTIEYALKKGLSMDFSLASDQVKSVRGLVPVVTYAYCKFKDVDSECVNCIVKENEKAFLNFKYIKLIKEQTDL